MCIRDSGDTIVYCKSGRETPVINVHSMHLLGRHNYENVMAAAAMSMQMGVPLEKITQVIRDFRPVEHRIEFVRERTGVKYYNDSKGTNPDAAIQALRAMPGPTILIAGGYDKNKMCIRDSQFRGRDQTGGQRQDRSVHN